MKRTEEAQLTVMVMIRKKDTQLVAVEERRKGHWDGLIFPGGHVEEGESFLEAAKREAEEETGLSVSDVTFCGLVHWAHRTKKERYLAFLYTAEGEGELLPETHEGRNFWMPLEEFWRRKASPPRWTNIWRASWAKRANCLRNTMRRVPTRSLC